MFKFTVAILCASLLLLQANGDDLTSSKNEVKKAFESMMKAIDKALTQAQTALDKALAQVSAEATKVEDKAKKEVDKVVAPLEIKLDNLVKKAADLGLDVTKCQTYVDQFAAIPNNTVDGIVGCITTQVAKAKGYCDDALSNCKKIEEDLATIDNQIDDCGGNFVKKAKCYAKLLEEIIDDTSKAPQHIVEDITKATALVTEILPILEQCEINEVKGVGSKATELVAKWAVCAGIPHTPYFLAYYCFQNYM